MGYEHGLNDFNAARLLVEHKLYHEGVDWVKHPEQYEKDSQGRDRKDERGRRIVIRQARWEHACDGTGKPGLNHPGTGTFKWLDRLGADFLERLSEAKTWHNSALKDGLKKSLADTIMCSQRFAQDRGGHIYLYDHGVYVDGGHEYIKERVQGILEEWKQSKKWSKRLGDEVVEYIRLRCPQLLEKPMVDILNVENGLLNLDTMTLMPHTPENLTTVQLPVEYDPDAKCPRIDQFVGEVFPEDSQRMAYEIVAYTMRPTTDKLKAIMLLGEGGTGKSAYLRMLSAFLGKSNIVSTGLQDLTNNRFAAIDIYGKLACISAENSDKAIEDSKAFKNITGGDGMRLERKYGGVIQNYEPICALIFAMNKAPKSMDDSDAFFDRWHVVPFTRRFRGTEEEIPREILDAMLSTPEEQSGLLNRALLVLPSFKRSGFTVGESVRRAGVEFRQGNNALRAWLIENTFALEGATTVKQTLRLRYNANAAEEVNDEEMGKAVKALYPQVKTVYRGPKGSQRYAYLGIALKSSEDATVSSGNS